MRETARNVWAVFAKNMQGFYLIWRGKGHFWYYWFQFWPGYSPIKWGFTGLIGHSTICGIEIKQSNGIKRHMPQVSTGDMEIKANFVWMGTWFIGLLVQYLHALKHPKALFHFTPITTQLQHHLRISLRWFQSCHMTRRQAQLKGRWSHCHAKCPANDRESAGHRVGPRAMHLANFA